MSEQSAQHSEELVADAVVASRGGLSIVWLIPLIALVAGAWLAYKAYSEQGPTIEIRFSKSSGVTAGKTMIRYRDVDIGKVDTVRLDETLDGVIVTAGLHPGSERLLGEQARFWIEQPEVSITGVSGLQTVLSGVFIGIEPDTTGTAKRDFVGLEEAPFILQGRPGRLYTLEAPDRSSLHKGAPVLFRDFKVGEIVEYQLVGRDRVDVTIFVDAPYDDWITERTLFWNGSGVDVELSADGLTVNSKSLVSILMGGVTFDTPSDGPAAEKAAAGSRFVLFPDRATAFRPAYRKRRMLLYFEDSVRGLTVGAPVEYRGVRLGEVVDVRAQLIGDEFALRIPVLIDVEFERLEVIGELDRGARESRENRGVANLQRMVDAGLRAQLKTGSLLTGQKLISLDLFPEAPPVSVAVEGDYPIVPTIPSVLDTVTQQVAGLLEKLQRLPLESISAELLQTVSRVREIVTEADPQSALNALTGLLQQAEGLVGRLDQNIAPQLDETMQQTSRFARNLNATLQPQLEDTLRELKDAARAIRTMSDYLERHPEALIKGKQP